MAKSLKTGLRRGGGVPPGYRWNVVYLSMARDDAMQFLDEGQYAHVIDQFKALASEENPRKPATVSVDAVEDFFELRDKGGILGKINLRVFFTILPRERTILVLGAIKKEADGQTPTWARIRIRHRWRRYRNGEFGDMA